MQTIPEISVIIPVYNVEDYVIECLDSVVSQDIDKPIEIIIIDDCGTDRSISLVEEYSSKHKNASRNMHIIHHEHNSGLSAARNTGIRYSSGNYLYFIDSDDILASETSLRLLHERITGTDADFVFGEHCFWRDGISEGKTTFYKKSKGSIKGRDNILYSYLKKWEMIACNKLIRRNFIVDNSLYFPEGIYYEDNYWAFTVALKANLIMVIPEITYNYRQRSGSITNAFTQKHYDSIIRCTELHYNKIISDNLLDVCNKNTLIRFYERFRQNMLWAAFRNLEDDEQATKELFYTLGHYSIASWTDILTNWKMPISRKKKSLAFQMGEAGYTYLLHKYRKSARHKTYKNK